MAHDASSVAHSPGYVVEVVVWIVAHPVRRAERDRAVDDTRVGAHIAERLVSRVRPEHPVPDPAERSERDIELRTLALCFSLACRVLAIVQIVQTGENRLNECIPSGRMHASSVDIRDEERATIGGSAGKNPNLRWNHLSCGL